MVFQHFWAPEPTPHRPVNRPIFHPNGQKEKKQKKELALSNEATSIGLRPLSVNRRWRGSVWARLPDPDETESDDFSFLLVVVAARSEGSGGCAALWTSAVGVKRF